jgi:hypothetical protein
MACGDALLKVQESLPHGKWLSFLKRLEDQPGAPAERTALRYVQLAKNRALIMARLAALKPSNSPRVANLSVRQAVALIPKPPRPTRTSVTTPRPRLSSAVTTPSKLNCHVISQWLSKAPVEDRQKVFDALGSRAVNESIPPSWDMQLAPAEELARLQQQIAELEAGSATPPRQRKQSLSPPKPTDDGDGDGLDIPDCLRRTPILPANDAAIVPDEVPHRGGNGGAPLSIDAPLVSVEKTAAAR